MGRTILLRHIAHQHTSLDGERKFHGPHGDFHVPFASVLGFHITCKVVTRLVSGGKKKVTCKMQGSSAPSEAAAVFTVRWVTRIVCGSAVSLMLCDNYRAAFQFVAQSLRSDLLALHRLALTRSTDICNNTCRYVHSSCSLVGGYQRFREYLFPSFYSKVFQLCSFLSDI
jgi:hypothetical protein